MKQNKEEIYKFSWSPNTAINIVADTSTSVITEMDRKPISGRGYTPCFKHFLLNAQFPNEKNYWVTLLEILEVMLI